MIATLTRIFFSLPHRYNERSRLSKDSNKEAPRLLSSILRVYDIFCFCTKHYHTNVFIGMVVSIAAGMMLLTAPAHAYETKRNIISSDDGSQTINIIYLKIQRDEFPGVPAYLSSPSNDGISGALSALKDANKTGKFLGYQLALTSIILSESEKANETQQALLKDATAVIIDSDPPFFEDAVQSILMLGSNALLFNVRNHDNSLRSQFCEAPLLHIAPTYQMKTDALGQWFRTKRIEEILMLVGSNPEDRLFAEAFERTAKQFKLEIVENKAWQLSFDLRRSAFNEIPVFTRSSKEYKAVFVADHAQQFAYSLPYNTYYQVPISGNAGLQALGWHPTHEQWGARQLQGRFAKEFTRPMTQYDYYAYVAVTSISSAVQALKDVPDDDLYQYLLSDDASIAAYKGRKLSFVDSTRQLRQPLLLAHEGALVTSAPLPGFLHQSNDLDTLGAIVTGCEDN